MTPSSLAHAVGVTEGAIRQMESGQTKSASFVIGLRIADALGVTPWFLATGEDAAPGKVSRSPDDPVLKLIEDLQMQVEDLRTQLHTTDRRVKAPAARKRSGKRRKAGE